MAVRILAVLLMSLKLFSNDAFGQIVVTEARSGSLRPTSAALRLESWERHQSLQQSSPFTDLKWRCIGPRMAGGRIEAIACPSDSASTMYVGAGSGGVWKTINNGITWKPIFEDQPTQAIGDIAISASDPSVVWVGSGEVLMARSALAGIGVFKSTDAGESWRHMGLADTHHIGKVAVDPANPEIVYVAAIGHRHSSNDNRGIFKTVDGGETWTHSLFIDATTSAIDLFISVEDSGTLFCTTWQRDEDGQDHYGENSGIFRSTDSGRSWARLNLSFDRGTVKSCGRVAIAQAASQPATVYALLDNAVIEGNPPIDLLCRSDDRGDTWQVVNTEALSTGWDWCEIQVSPDNPEEIISIGQKSFVSRNGGKTFEEIGGTIVHLLPHEATSLHLDTHSMWINPTNSQHLVFGNDGGLFVSYDQGSNWLHLNNLPIAECYAVTYDQSEPFNVYTGTQDNAALFGPSTHDPQDGAAEEWQQVYVDRWGGGDSYFTYRDPSDSDSVYYEHQYGDLKRKNMSTGETKSIRPPAGMVEGQLRNAWMTPYFPSQHNATRLYYAANYVFQSDDRGESWKAISPDLASGPTTPNLRYQAITTLSESPLNANLLIAGTDNGNLFLTSDGGGSWAAIDAELPRCQFTRATFSNHDPNSLFVTLSGLATDDFSPYVYRSNDLGKTWNSISEGLPLETVNVIAEDPHRADVLYLGSDLGVYVSTNGGKAWESLSVGLPAASVHDLFVHPGTRELVIGTHGRSVWVLDVSSVGLSVD